MTYPRRIVLAPDKFKGSLTASEVADALMQGVRAVHPDAVTSHVPVADGGDGSLAVAFARGYEPMHVAAADTLGRTRQALLARSGQHAIVELAAVCGLQQLPGGRPAPEQSTTLGLGQAVRAALEAGCTRITLALGGSASTDGGAGLLVGLGATLLDRHGRPVPPDPAHLPSVARIDLAGLDARVREADIEVAVDVSAPLLGPTGAATVFAPQKGADPAAVRRLESALDWWAQIVRDVWPQTDPETPGMGAAGGTALAAAAVGGRLVPGAETFLELAGFDDVLSTADLVITGEGRLDSQTLLGKAPGVVAQKSAAAGIPCVAVVGSLAADVSPPELRQRGFSAVHQLVDVDPAVATDPDLARTALVRLGALIAANLPAPPALITR